MCVVCVCVCVVYVCVYVYVCACKCMCMCMCISGVAVTEIINYNSIYLGFRPLNYTFKSIATIYNNNKKTVINNL